MADTYIGILGSGDWSTAEDPEKSRIDYEAAMRFKIIPRGGGLYKMGYRLSPEQLQQLRDAEEAYSIELEQESVHYKKHMRKIVRPKIRQYGGLPKTLNAGRR